MVSPAREYSLAQHLLEQPKYSGMQKRKSGRPDQRRRQPKEQRQHRSGCRGGAGRASPQRTHGYLMDTLLFNKLMNLPPNGPRNLVLSVTLGAMRALG
jgi:hypothetical protein